MILLKETDGILAERRKKKFLILYIAIACAYAAVALLLLFLSPDGYLPYMIGDILLTIAFGFFSIFFFTVLYDEAGKRSRLYDKVLSALSEREYGVFLKEEEPKTVDGVSMRVLLFVVAGTERELHCLSKEIAFEKEKKYLLEIRAGVLTEAESAYD